MGAVLESKEITHDTAVEVENLKLVKEGCGTTSEYLPSISQYFHVLSLKYSNSVTGVLFLSAY